MYISPSIHWVAGCATTRPRCKVFICWSRKPRCADCNSGLGRCETDSDSGICCNVSCSPFGYVENQQLNLHLIQCITGLVRYFYAILVTMRIYALLDLGMSRVQPLFFQSWMNTAGAEAEASRWTRRGEKTSSPYDHDRNILLPWRLSYGKLTLLLAKSHSVQWFTEF